MILFFALVLAGLSFLQPPEAPTGLIATPDIDGIRTNWQASLGADIVDYRVSRRREGEVAGFFVGTVPHPETAFFDSTALGGVTYSYKVQARDIFAAASAFSDSVTARFLDRIDPTRPDSLMATSSEDGIFLSWSPNPEPDLEGYRVLRAETSGSFDRIGAAEGTGFLDTTAVIARPYTYRVLAIDLSGNEGPPSDPILAVLADRVGPARITEMEAIGIADGIFLSWAEAPEPDVAGYRLRRGVETDQSTPLVELPLGQLSYLDTTAVERAFYIYRVAAFDQSGNEGEPAFAQALRPDVRAPNTPTNLTAIWSEVSLALEWTPNPEADLAGYRVQLVSLVDSSSSIVEVPPQRSRVLLTPFGSGRLASYSITAVDSSGNTSAPTRSIQTALVPSEIQIETGARTLGTASGDRLDYRLVSVPGDHSIELAATFSGVRGVDWELLDSGGTNAPSSLILRPGEAAWAFSKQPWTLPRQQVSQVIPQGLGFTYKLALTPGWNVLANPFSIPLDWPLITSWNQTQGALFEYSGQYGPTTRFRPYAGYLYYNRGGLDSLTLPFSSELRQDGVWAPEQVMTLRIESGWTRSVEIAVDPAADSGIDALDRFAPPQFFGGPRLVVLDDSDQELRSLVLPPFDEPRTFRLRVQRATGVIDVSINGSLSGSSSYLIDEAGIPHRLGADPVQIVIRSESASLSLVVGRDDSPPPEPPLGIGIDSVFPNPATSWVAVEFSNDVLGSVRLEVFDLLGRLVGRLSSGTLAAGRYQVIWSPSEEVTAGSYVLRLETPSGETSRMVTLVR